MGIIPTGARREELFDELLKHERKLKRLRDEKKETMSDVNGRIKAVEAKRDRCMDLLEGREVEQPGLPFGGAEDDAEVEREEKRTKRGGAGKVAALAQNGVLDADHPEVKAAQEELRRRAKGGKKGAQGEASP